MEFVYPTAKVNTKALRGSELYLVTTGDWQKNFGKGYHVVDDNGLIRFVASPRLCPHLNYKGTWKAIKLPSWTPLAWAYPIANLLRKIGIGK